MLPTPGSSTLIWVHWGYLLPITGAAYVGETIIPVPCQVRISDDFLEIYFTKKGRQTTAFFNNMLKYYIINYLISTRRF